MKGREVFKPSPLSCFAAFAEFNAETSMKNRHLRTACAFIALCSLCAQLPPKARARQRSAIATYAITNARIFPVSGPVIERGTVVIRDGLIAAVGPQASAPADARVIDGTGLSVYPGLIDANTTLGIPDPAL